MNKVKIWFGLLILFFLVIFLIAPFWFDSIFNLHTDKDIIVYNQIESNSCHINAIEPTIILRMDDVRAYSKLTHYIVEEIINRNISITLGLIPEDLEKDRIMIKYLREIKDNPLIEIAQHGRYHDESDINITNESLLEGYRNIQNIIGVAPITYIPPYNKISKESKDIVSDYFRIISGKGAVVKEGEKIAEISETIGTYDYLNNRTISIQEVVSKCKEGLDKTNICVITLHPQEYAVDITSADVLSQEKFDKFKEMLDEIQKLNTKFKKFHEVVICSLNNSFLY